MTPARLGGSQLGSEVMIDVTIELASACPATGWVHMLWTAHMWLLALFPQDTQEELWSNPNTLASSVVDTTGDVVPVEGGYRWTGRGFFSSGVDHCNWLTVLAPIRREGVEGPPELRWMLLPREDIEIIDDWYTVVLKGTGSKTVVVNDAFYPRATDHLEQGHRGRYRARLPDPFPPDVSGHLLGQLHSRDGRSGHWRGTRLPVGL
jgi:alkylation response protein AidB-like acyl-CoA dehydrogenase